MVRCLSQQLFSGKASSGKHGKKNPLLVLLTRHRIHPDFADPSAMSVENGFRLLTFPEIVMNCGDSRLLSNFPAQITC
jgi:hypothetical protein